MYVFVLTLLLTPHYRKRKDVKKMIESEKIPFCNESIMNLILYNESVDTIKMVFTYSTYCFSQVSHANAQNHSQSTCA